MSACLRLAVIADDSTGGSDAASMLLRAGARVVQTFGVPPGDLLREAGAGYDAVVASLKCRSVEAGEARRMVRSAVEALRPMHPAQWQYKYCSTFDSTERGNIGPLCEELLELTGEAFTVAVPALPVNGRTQYRGHLFVLGELLSESPMKDHPLNPMRDANLVRHLQRQTRRTVGLITLETVRAGAEAVRREMERMKGEGVAIALADAVIDEDLAALAQACRNLRLVTGGSGITAALPGTWAEWRPAGGEASGARVQGRTLLMAGSCSAATLGQLRDWRAAGGAVAELDAQAAKADAAAEARRLMEELRAVDGVALVSSSAAPGARVEGAAAAIERVMAEVARRAMEELGVRRFAVAGGETSGAVIDALGLRAAAVERELSPGVPVLAALEPAGLKMILKSGNFGPPDFFRAACEALESGDDRRAD